MNLPTDSGFAGRNVIFGPEGGPAVHVNDDMPACEDTVVIGTFLNQFYSGLKISHRPSWAEIYRVFIRMDAILHEHTTVQAPSIFKRCAAFTMAFMEICPLTEPFTGALDQCITNIDNHQNAVAAIAYCRQCLNGATFEHPPGTTVKLGEKIKFSLHFYCDIIHAVAAIKDNPHCFHSMALLYESLSYKANPGTSDPEVI